MLFMLGGSDYSFLIREKWNVVKTESHYLGISFSPQQPLMFTTVPDLILHSLSGKNILEYINRPPTAKLRLALDSLSLDPENARGRGTLGLAYDSVVPP